MQLGSRIAVAVAVAGSHSSDLTPSLGTSICHGCSPKKQKTKTPKTKTNTQMTAISWGLPIQINSDVGIPVNYCKECVLISGCVRVCARQITSLISLVITPPRSENPALTTQFEIC